MPVYPNLSITVNRLDIVTFTSGDQVYVNLTGQVVYVVQIQVRQRVTVAAVEVGEAQVPQIEANMKKKMMISGSKATDHTQKGEFTNAANKSK